MTRWDGRKSPLLPLDELLQLPDIEEREQLDAQGSSGVVAALHRPVDDDPAVVRPSEEADTILLALENGCEALNASRGVALGQILQLCDHLGRILHSDAKLQDPLELRKRPGGVQ